MKIGKQFKVEVCASKDQTRDAITEPYVTKHEGKPVIVATDGRRLVCVPVEIEGEHELGYCSGEALKRARKIGKGKFNPAEVALNGDEKLADGQTLPRKTGNFPNWPQVIPQHRGTLRIGLDAKLLAGIAEALGTGGHVVLEIIDPLSPIRVTDNKNGEGFAVLVPVRIG